MTIFLRLLAPDDKGAALADAVDALRAGQRHATAFAASPASFAQVPGSPFAYWVKNKISRAFSNFESFEFESRVARRGPSTGDDFRRVRVFWETNLPDVCRYKLWVPFSKGGVYSPYYSDIHLLVAWDEERRTFKDFYGRPGRMIERPESLEFFFQPGLTWPRRTTRGMSVRVLPSGCIFADKGPSAFAKDVTDTSLLAIMNSRPFAFFVALQLGAADVAARSYDVGIVQNIPIPNLNAPSALSFSVLALACVNLKRDLDRANEISHVFHLPALLQSPGATLAERIAAWAGRIAATNAQLAANQREIDDIAFDLYGIVGDDRRAIEEGSVQKAEGSSDGEADDSDDEGEDAAADTRTLVAALASYLVGAPFGRWDIRYATGERAAPELPDPFAPLPVCPPGMLQNAQGLPATSADVPASYPLRIAWPGILVDDEGHPEDIAGRVREALGVIWGERADAIEQEACEILGVHALRDYLRKPASFFADHLGRYSKSRRQAPIYWPLATASGGYTLWLYYHRLSDQTLYSCVNDFVDPKLATVSEQAAGLRRKSGRTANEERELEGLSDSERELAEFRAELLRVAAFWKPNLNDGVQITAAPLWTLFAHKPWQKKLKETWASLEAGDYDWAHLAYSVWPERVREKCKGDKSLAIAHDLEALYVAPPATAGKKRGRAKQIADQEEAPLDDA